MESLPDVETVTANRIEAIKSRATKKIQNAKSLLKKEEQKSYIEFYKQINLFLLTAQDEIALHHALLEVKSLDVLWMKTSGNFLKNMKIFSLCASLESKQMINLTPLRHDSSQASQCRQAVYDSVDLRLLKGKNSIVKGLEVSNVFKIENLLLSHEFQLAASELDQNKVKIKGMFCCLSKDDVYSFASYGLNVSKFSGTAYQKPWFLRDTSDAYEFTSKTKSAQELAASHHVNPHHLRFSKHSLSPSMLSNISSETADIDELSGGYENIQTNEMSNEATVEGGGVCLVLCRVLMFRVCTVPGVIEEKDVRKAIAKGYDAIYSQSLEEYTLLNPSFVIPEFIMHTTVRRRTCEEEILERKNKLQSRVNGLLEGLQPTELSTFMQSLHESDSIPLAVKQNIANMSISSSSLLSKLTSHQQQHGTGSGSSDTETTAAAAGSSNSGLSNKYDEMSASDSDYNNKKKKVNKNHIGVTSSGAVGAAGAVATKKKKSKSSSVKNSVAVSLITADTTSLSTRAEAILQGELDSRRASRINVICDIEQLTVDFTNRRGVIMKECFRSTGRPALM